MSRFKIKGKNVKFNETIDFEKLLGDIPKAMRRGALVAAVQNGGHVIARALDKAAPVENPNIKDPKGVQLKNSHEAKAFAFEDGNAIAIVGAQRPQGAHSHLVSIGHKVVPRGAGKQKLGDDASDFERGLAEAGSNKGSGKTPLTGAAFVEGKRYMEKGFAAGRPAADRAVIKSLQRSFKLASEGKPVT